MSDIRVRQAVLADLDGVAALFDAYRQFYGQAADRDAARAFLLRRFEHGESVLFIAEAGGDAVGFIQLYPMFSSVALARIFVLNDLYVHPSARGLGAGRYLLDAATTYARALGAVRVVLETTVDNTTAQALYAATGWSRQQGFHVYTFDLLR
ncbi:MAG TPA: GNAT family N-acetyltransferase [Xanthomonadaceae bacterium]|nr:GNAT family N-acetyltransferase [Xanthomonadaceae bacterium]